MESLNLNLSHESKVATEVYRTVDPLNFYNNFLKEGIRPDGRKLTSYRKYNVKDLLNNTLYMNYDKYNQSNEYTLDLDNNNNSLTTNNHHLYKQNLTNVLISSIYLTSGNSRYHCKLTGDLTVRDNTSVTFNTLPSIYENPDDVFSVDINLPKHVLTEVYDLNGPCINITHMVSNLIQTVLNSSEVISKEQFFYDVLYSNLPDNLKEYKLLSYFKRYKLRWKLNFEISCDEYDGNIIDSCFLCCTNALNYSKLPFIVFLLESNNLYPTLLTRSLMDSKELLEFNKGLLYLQLKQTHLSNDLNHFQFSTNDLSNYLLNNNLFKNIHMDYVPYTLTFCKCLNYFLVDPSMEDERVGINYSIYALKKNNVYRSSNMSNHNNNINNPNNNINEIDLDNPNDISLQPLDLMGLSDLSQDVLDQLYRLSLVLLKSL